MMECVVLYNYGRQIDLTARATILLWTVLPGRLSNVQNELSFLVDDTLAAEVPGAENVGLQVEGNFGGSLSNRVRGHGNISSFLDSLALASLLLVSKAAQDVFQSFVASR